jgi:ribonucleotide monophosphatase NagD (HAD superfamily)
LKHELQSHGIRVVNPECEKNEGEEMTSTEVGEKQVDHTVKVVLVGYDTSFTYRKLCQASLYLDLNNAIFIATNRDRVFKTHKDDRLMPAGGSIVKCIEAGTGIAPLLTIGKPNTIMFDLLR